MDRYRDTATILRQIIDENQQQLPVEDRFYVNQICLRVSPDTICRCTKELDHTGEHIAHGITGGILSRWK